MTTTMSEPHELEERAARAFNAAYTKTGYLFDGVCAVLALVRQEQETLNEAVIVAGGDIITREYGESDWEEAKDMAEGLNPNPVYLAMIRAWWLSHTAPQEK